MLVTGIPISNVAIGSHLNCFVFLFLQDSMGKGVTEQAMTGRFNWLCRSHVADNPAVVASVAKQVGCPPRKAVEVRPDSGSCPCHVAQGIGSHCSVPAALPSITLLALPMFHLIL